MITLVTYATAITCAKISLLVLFRRIFETRAFKVKSLIVGGICLAWFVAAVIVNIFQCRPFDAAFNPKPTARCINVKAFYIAFVASNLVIDVILLCLPIHMVWQLQLAVRQKVALSAIFGLGGL